MKRSWVFVFYDVALFAVLLLPLAVAAALQSGRSYAAAIYMLSLIGVLSTTILIAHFTKITPRTYLRSLSRKT